MANLPLPSPSLLSPTAIHPEPKRPNEPQCFVNFRKALQKYTIRPKKPEEERLSGAQWRGHQFVRLTEFTHWLEHGLEQRSSPLEELLREVYAEADIAPTVNHILDGQTRCLVTFCILLEIGAPRLLAQFQYARLFDGNLPMTLASLDEKVGEALKDANMYDFDQAANLAKAFNDKQWKYFPADLSDVGQRWDAPYVLPFVDRQLITDKGGTSNVYQVAVPERFVDDHMKDKVASSMLPHPDFQDLGDCCHFALKVFETENVQIFKDEVAAYKMMTDTANKGMLMYLSDFTLVDDNHTTHTIVLQYAETDLSEYFYRTSPILPGQILDFWKNLSSIAPTLRDLHEFKINRFDKEHTYEGWHADIKSDNILLVDGRVKLADPGFAKFQRRKDGPAGDRASHQFTGGTTTYGAPERHNFTDEVKNPRASDMWSLGCVLSESATWVVLGHSGVRQFRDLRLNAVLRRCAQEDSRCSSSSSPNKRDVQYDYFHDGEQVLPEVKEWHKALRLARRPTDVLSDKILDLVDKHLLVANPADRFSAMDVCDWLDEHLGEAESALSQLGDMSSAVQKAISIALEKEAEELQEHLESRSKIARAAAKVDPTYLQVPGLTASKKTPVDNVSQADAPAQRKRRGSRNGATREILPARRSSNPSSAGSTSVGQSTTHRRKGKRYCVFHAHYTFMDKSLRNEQDRGEVRTSGIFNRLRPGATKSKDKKLAEYIQDRDLVFIMDNGATMDHFWYEAVFVLETLYNKCRGSDEDGVDLYFTCSSERVKNAKGDSGWKAFKNKVWSDAIKPNAESRTNMQRALTERLTIWLQEYEQRMQEARGHFRDRRHNEAHKDLTVIVLTDGVWQAHQDDPTAVDDAIVNFNENFRRAARTHMPPRTVSIQFVSFGADPVALERFRRLDDNLGQKGVPDIVDHEPSTGDVYKMLVGSISERMDSLDSLTDADTSPSLEQQPDSNYSHLLPVRSISSRSTSSRFRHGSSSSTSSQRPFTLSPQQTRERLPSITANMYHD